MSEERPRKEPAGIRLTPSVLLNVGLIVALVLLIVCQLVLVPLVLRPKTKTAESLAAGSASVVRTTDPRGSAALQLTSCSDDDLPDAVALVRAAIVNIDVASSDVGPGARRGGAGMSFDMPPTDALETNEETLGSGIVVSAEGYVLTCHHLIRGYSRIFVTVFNSDRKTYQADVVGVDAENDLALLKIPVDSPILVAKLANSDLVKTTDPVLAIGSPFGFEHTVTAGIVSDNKRNAIIGEAVYYGLFQTDASINRGSAGGALINTEGEVVAVNTAIASPAEFFSGISFAIPINKARALLLKAVGER